jgi:hypothetical protein
MQHGDMNVKFPCVSEHITGCTLHIFSIIIIQSESKILPVHDIKVYWKVEV